MKKISLYVFMFLCLLLVGCGDDKLKDVATLEEFDTIATQHNFIVSDNADYDEVSYILDAKLAQLDANSDGVVADDTDISIQMIKYASSDDAKKVQDSQIEEFSTRKTTAAFENKSKGDNYYSYELISNNRYMVSIRVEDTLVFCKTLVDNKEIVEEILDELEY